MQNNYIIGVLGKKGSGKTEFVKSSLKHIKRYIVIDPLAEYPGVIFDRWYDLLNFIDRLQDQNFTVVYRPMDREDEESFFLILNEINNYTLIAEEVDYWCSSYEIHPEIDYITRYGRHFKRNLIWISRNPFEINRFLTRQSDVLVTFRQTEPRDLDYFARYDFNKDLEKLKEFEFAYSGDKEVLTKILKKKIT